MSRPFCHLNSLNDYNSYRSYKSTVLFFLQNTFIFLSILQAVAKDRIFPYIHVFAKGYGAGEEPRRAYLLAFAIGLAFICIGKSVLNCYTVEPLEIEIIETPDLLRAIREFELTKRLIYATESTVLELTRFYFI